MLNKCLECGKEVEEEFHGMHPKCFADVFRVKVGSDFQHMIPRKADEAPYVDKIGAQFGSSFFHGAYKKYSASLEGKNYILKVQESDYPELPQVEYISNLIAKELEIEVPEFHYINFSNSVPTFATRNFKDLMHGCNVVHIWHYLKEEDQFNCEVLINTILEVTGRPIDARKFMEICLFDALIGNHDRHGRNLAIIETKNKRVLAPCYDNPSYVGIEIDGLLGAELSPRGKIFTAESDKPTIGSYIKEFKRLEHKDIVDEFSRKIDIDRINDLTLTVPLSEKRRIALVKLIERNFEELCDETQ